jgi:predicted nucleic acid-binding protein
MPVLVVLDTNILLYAISKQRGDQAKRSRAIELMQEANWATSTQVLQEFYVNATRGKVANLSVEQAKDAVEVILASRVCVGMDAETLRTAIEIHQRHQISYWDAAVIATAVIVNAGTLYSEDLNHGQTYDGVIVVNPFAGL